MIKGSVTIGIGCALVVSAAFADWPCAAEDTTLYKIEAAERAGSLSSDEALMYKFMGLYAAYGDEMPAAYRGEWYGPRPWTCGTPVVMELWRRWPRMDPAVKATLREVCGLGETQWDLFARYRRCSWGNSSYGGIRVYTYDVPKGHFRLHYVLDGQSKLVDPSDHNGNGVPDCVENLGADFERAFKKYVDDDWYYHPDPEDQKYFPLKDRYAGLDWPEEGQDYGGNDPVERRRRRDCFWRPVVPVYGPGRYVRLHEYEEFLQSRLWGRLRRAGYFRSRVHARYAVYDRHRHTRLVFGGVGHVGRGRGISRRRGPARPDEHLSREHVEVDR